MTGTERPRRQVQRALPHISSAANVSFEPEQVFFDRQRSGPQRMLRLKRAL